jgi:hypothetical protein
MLSDMKKRKVLPISGPMKIQKVSGKLSNVRNSLEDQIVDLALKGKLANASRQAIRRQQKMGLAITYKRGNDIVKQFPDGRIETLAKVDSPKYRFPKGVRILGGK